MRPRYFSFGFVLMLFVGGCGSDSSDSSESSSSSSEGEFTYEMAVGEWEGVIGSGGDTRPMRLNIYADRMMELYSLGAGRETPKSVESYENGVLKQMRYEQDDRFVEVHQLAPDRLLVKSYTAQGERAGEWRTTRGGEETLRISFDVFRMGGPYVAPVEPESESSSGTSNTLVTTVAVVVILLIVALSVGIFFMSRGESSNKRRHQRRRLGDVVEQAGKGLSSVLDQAGDKLNQMELGGLPSVERIRLRRDETRLIAFLLTVIVLAILWYSTFDTFLYAGLLIVACIAGGVQARRMYIRWLFYTFIFFIVLSVVALLSYSQVIGFLSLGAVLYQGISFYIALIGIVVLIIYAEQYGIIHRLLNRGMPQSLRSRDTLSSWGKMIHGADGEGEAYWEIVIKHLEAVEAPHISWKYQVFSERLGLFTKKSKGIARKCLVVSSPSENYEILVGAWDYGSYLAIRQPIWMYKVKKPDDYRLTPEDFLRDDVSLMFRTAVHSAVTGALKEFVEGADIKEHDIQEMLQAW